MAVTDTQTLFNVAVGLAGALGGWWLKTVWEAVRDLQIADKSLVEKVTAIEVLVAGCYVTREEFKKDIETLFKKLDHIAEVVSRKADR